MTSRSHLVPKIFELEAHQILSVHATQACTHWNMILWSLLEICQRFFMPLAIEIP